MSCKRAGPLLAGQAGDFIQGRGIHHVEQHDFGPEGPGRLQRQPVGRQGCFRAVHGYQNLGDLRH